MMKTLKKCSSFSATVACSVLQGSILGPIYIAFYVFLLRRFFQWIIPSTCNADNIQLYFSFKSGDTDLRLSSPGWLKIFFMYNELQHMQTKVQQT